jgi:hypothetical protein
MLRHTAFAAAFVLLLGAALDAAPIAGFTFPNLETTPPPGSAGGYNPTTVDSNVTVTGISAGSGLLVSGGIIEVSNPTTSYSTQPVLRVSAAGGVTALGTSVSSNSYFQFTVTPDPGASLNLTSLTFNSGRGGGTTPRGFAVFSSELGMAVGDQILLEPTVPTIRPNFTSYNIDLTGPEFQGINGPTTFRFNIFMPAAGNSLEFDDILLSGSAVFLPEPSSIALWGTIGAAACALVVVGRRRRRA